MLTLLYRGTDNGWTPYAWHTLCDNQGSTLTIIRNYNNKKFGGYTDIPWKSTGGFQTGSGNSYLFVLETETNFNKMTHKAGPETFNSGLYLVDFGAALFLEKNCPTNGGSAEP